MHLHYMRVRICMYGTCVYVNAFTLHACMIMLSSIERYWLGVYESRKRGRRRLSKGRGLNSLSILVRSIRVAEAWEEKVE